MKTTGISVRSLPQPDCRYGFTVEQLQSVFSPEEMEEFDVWMAGQTRTLCTGQRYDHDLGDYVPGCGPHGSVTYPHDVRAFLMKLPPLD